jgi:hypothetical protein
MICDILLKPKSDDGCPVLVEIQNAVSSTWLREKLLTYCSQIIRKTKKKPVVIVFPIHDLPKEVYEAFDEEKDHWFAHQITSKLHAKKLYLIDPATIRNATTKPLPPIAALAVFFADQAPSFFESDYFADPTVKRLYDLAFKICEQGGLETVIMRRSSIHKHLIKKIEQLQHVKDGSIRDYADQMHDELATMSRSPSPSTSTETASTSAAAASTSSATASASSATASTSTAIPSTSTPPTPSPTTSMTCVQKHNITDIVKFCRRRRAQKRTWAQIYEEGLYEKFVFKSVDTLRTTYSRHKNDHQ